jgi:type I restriction enzyme S subunit
LSEVAVVTDFVANGSFESLRLNVQYRNSPDYAVLVRLVDHNSAWNGGYVYVDEPSYRFLKKSSLIPGDVVIANVGANAGTVFRVPELDRPMTLGPNAILCRPQNNELLREYLYYYLVSNAGSNSIQSIITGSAQPKFNKTDLRNLQIPLPPLPEQRRIAKILGDLDDKIELNRKMNETLEQIARALFKSWFIDFDPVRAKMDGRMPEGMDADTAALFPSRLVESELGLVPEGWEVKALGDVVDVVKGRSYRSSELAESDTALVTLKSFLRGGGYRSDGLKPFTGEYKANQCVLPGELVVALTDVTQAADVIGKPAIVRGDNRFVKLVASLDVGIIRPQSMHVSTPFLYCLLLTDDAKAHMYSHTSGTTVLHLSSNAIPSMLSVFPPQQIGECFAVTANATFQQIESNEYQSRTLASLRDTLLPQLMRGGCLSTTH